MSDLDPAAIMAAHADMHHCLGTFTLYGGRCLPYRLADELANVRREADDVFAELKVITAERDKALADLGRERELVRIVAMDYGSACDNPKTCSCSMAQAVRAANT